MKSDDFHGRPYGFTTNQISHTTVVGFLGLTYLTTVISYLVFGEFPPKEIIAVIAGVGYLIFELVSQGWDGWDTAEDWWFVNAYGVWGPLMVFTEVVPGEPQFIGDITSALPFVLLFYTHLACGALYRSLQKKGFL